jgi:hypothetical protein
MAYAAATRSLTAAKASDIAAQWGLNAALYACPLTWILITIIAIIGAIYLVIGIINRVAGTSISATGIIFGAFFTLGAFLRNLFLGLFELVSGVINAMVNPFIRIANFIGNVFTNPVSSVIYLFQSMADGILSILQTIASALDFVFGSNMADTVAGWRVGIKEMADAAVAEYAPNENYQNVMSELNLSVESTGLARGEYGDAWGAGYTAGENLGNSILNFDSASLPGSNTPDMGGYGAYDPSSMARDVANINSNTSGMKDVGEENLKYLRDISEREAINRFTTAEIKFDMGGVHNTVSSTMDLDGIADYIGDAMMERLEIVAEGVYA